MKKLMMLVVVVLVMVNVPAYGVLLGEIRRVGPIIGIRDFNFVWKSKQMDFDMQDMFEPFDASNFGITKTMTDTNPNFDTITSFLTNGDNNAFKIGIWGTMSGRQWENIWITKFVESDEPDFYGYEISEISLTYNGCTLTSYEPGKLSFSYDITYSFYGEPVPEPASLFLLGLGGLVLRRRKA